MEVRTEEERTPNHDGGKHTEPNETTPLTEPEYVGGRAGDPLTVLPDFSCPLLDKPGFQNRLRNLLDEAMPDPTLFREKALLVLLGCL